MTDLSKLSPAPWTVRPNEFDDWGLVRAGDGMPVVSAGCECRITDECRALPYGPERIAGPPEVAANAAFVALARNAFDVLMRRPWAVEAMSWNDTMKSLTFRVSDEMEDPIANGATWGDPFTALVEADAWMKEREATP